MTFNQKKGLLLNLWGLINPSKKQKLIILLFLTLIGGFAEILSIGSVVPFVASITSQDTLYNHPVMADFHELFNVGSPDDLILPMTLIYIALAILAGAIRTVLLKYGTTLSFAVGVDLDVLTYKHYVYQDYEEYINSNTSEAMSVITKKNTIINSSIIHAFITLLSASLMAAIVLSVLILINPFVSMVIFFIIGGIYLLVSRVTREIISNNGEVISSNSDHMLKNMQETFGSFRDVTIDKSQKIFIKNFSVFDEKVKKSEASNVFISQSPRLIIESLGMVLIATTAYLLSTMDSDFGVMPVLALLAVTAQRLMPLFQQIYFSISNLNSAFPVLRDVLAIVVKEKN
jgi:ABC-type multidrug transport system fused ATPase/permease subunit